MSVTLRTSASSVDVAGLIRQLEVNDSANLLNFSADAFTIASGATQFVIRGREIDEFLSAFILPAPISAYERIGFTFTDLGLFLQDIDSAAQDLERTLQRIIDQAGNSSDPVAFAQGQLDALGDRTGLTIDLLTLIEVGDRLDAAGRSDLFDTALTDDEIFDVLGIDTSSASFDDPDITSISVAQNGRSLFQITGDNLEDVLDSGDIAALFAGNDRIIGGPGNDRLDGLRGADEMIGGGGDDRYTIDNAGDRVVEEAGEGNDRVDVLINIPNFRAPENVELVVLMDGSISAISPNSGAKLVGIDDDNVFFAGLGTDFYDGNAGIDTLTYENIGAGVQASLLKPTAFNTGGAGTDKIDDIENLTGSRFDDVLVGAQGVSNIIQGLAGNDLIVGFAGPDILSGGSGADTFAYNRLNFRDSLIGGGEDNILDFSVGIDKIDLSRLRVSSDDLTLRRGRLEADVDGDGRADFAIDFANNATLSLNDIVGLQDASLAAAG